MGKKHSFYIKANKKIQNLKKRLKGWGGVEGE